MQRSATLEVESRASASVEKHGEGSNAITPRRKVSTAFKLLAKPKELRTSRSVSLFACGQLLQYSSQSAGLR